MKTKKEKTPRWGWSSVRLPIRRSPLRGLPVVIHISLFQRCYSILNDFIYYSKFTPLIERHTYILVADKVKNTFW
jgi:hypothetical protein